MAWVKTRLFLIWMMLAIVRLEILMLHAKE
jgi:hypothetical protein